MDRPCYAIVVAGGKGLRMGGEVPKQFMELAGRPILMRTLERFVEAVPSVQLVLVLPAEQVAYWQELCERYHFGLPHRLAYGGETRYHSVKNGLSLVPLKALVAVHDGVRPLVSAEVVRRCYEEAAVHGAVVPVVPVVESLRKVSGRKNAAVPRADYRIVQTPQVFDAGLLHAAYGRPYAADFTDDASVVEAAGTKVYLTEGNVENIKITHPVDLRLAELLLNAGK